MKKLVFALLFILGGMAHELRNPLSCHCITSSQTRVQRPRKRKDA